MFSLEISKGKAPRDSTFFNMSEDSKNQKYKISWKLTSKT